MDISGDEITLHAFDESPAGMINSFVKRFPVQDDELMQLYASAKSDMEY